MSSDQKSKVVLLIVAIAALFLLAPYLGLSSHRGEHADDEEFVSESDSSVTPGNLSDIESLLKGKNQKRTQHGQDQ